MRKKRIDFSKLNNMDRFNLFGEDLILPEYPIPDSIIDSFIDDYQSRHYDQEDACGEFVISDGEFTVYDEVFF